MMVMKMTTRSMLVMIMIAVLSLFCIYSGPMHLVIFIVIVICYCYLLFVIVIVSISVFIFVCLFACLFKSKIHTTSTTNQSEVSLPVCTTRGDLLY